MSNIKIEYGDVSVGAADAFEPTISSIYDISDDIARLTDGVTCATNPYELYCTSLDGSASLLETPYGSKGIWSLARSDSDGKFETPVVLTLTASEAFTVNGIRLKFDTVNNIFPTDTHVAIYNGTSVISESDITIDDASYTISGKYENFNKLILTFNTLNLPECRLRLSRIEFGQYIVFEDSEIKSVKFTQQISPIASELFINTCDITLSLKSPDAYTFAKSQPMMIYHRDKLIGQHFITSAKRQDQKTWNITAEDYIGLLESTSFDGKQLYGTSPSSELPDILRATGLEEIQLNVDTPSISLTGVIQAGTVREAFGQIAFASNLLVDTSYSDQLNVKSMPRTLTHEIPASRVMEGARLEALDKVTSVSAVSHAYSAAAESERETLYTAVENDLYNEVTVKFDGDKMYTNYQLSEVNNNFEFTPFYVTFTPYSLDSKVTAVPLKDSPITKVYKPSTVAGAANNDMKIENATLISRSNIDSILTRCYDQYSKRHQLTCKIVERPSDETIKVGDIVRVATPWAVDGGEKYFEGRVTKQTFSLVGGITIKEVTVE